MRQPIPNPRLYLAAAFHRAPVRRHRDLHLRLRRCKPASHPKGTAMSQFVSDVEEIRQRAARKIEAGAVTEAYKGDVAKTIAVLNEALATEIVCVLRYLHHYFMATGVHGSSVANEFKRHADSE